MNNRVNAINKEMPFKSQIVNQDRDNAMYSRINKCYNDSTFFFCVLGVEHIRQYHHKNMLMRDVVNVTRQLQKSKKSEFKNKIITIDYYILNTHIKSVNPKDNSSKTMITHQSYTGIYAIHKLYLNSLLGENITLINLKKTGNKQLQKLSDYLLIVKDGHFAY
ncbi:MAG: hypothetical protein LBU51_09610 [Bacteroidales bacterium]|nr:hypothetical protein [Bacteroidales bacterium]